MLTAFLLFFHIKVFFFSRCEGHDHWFQCSSVPDGHKYTSLKSSLRVARNYGRMQTHSWNAGGMLRARPPLFHLGFPRPTQPPPPTLAGVIRGAYRCAAQAYLTFSIRKLLTFSGLKCAISLYFAQTLLRNAKLVRGYQDHRNFALNTRAKFQQRRFFASAIQICIILWISGQKLFSFDSCLINGV